jgi:hypothetical protein
MKLLIMVILLQLVSEPKKWNLRKQFSIPMNLELLLDKITVLLQLQKFLIDNKNKLE